MFLQFENRYMSVNSYNACICLAGVMLMALLAQMSVPLPFTPVPMTGQILGVILLSLTLGRSRSTASIFLYLLAGAVGLPFFAQAHSGFGPTMGYLIGMLLASVVMGSLADRGWTSSFKKTLAAAFMGMTIIFLSGLVVLAFFIPANMLLLSGLFPFLPGSCIQAILATLIVNRLR